MIKKYLMQDQKGVIMIGTFILMMLFVVVGISLAELSTNHLIGAKRTQTNLDALYAAEAGADAFMANLATNVDYKGTNSAPVGITNSCTGYTSTPVTLTDTLPQGRYTYETCVQDGTIANEKIITTTGKVFLPSSSTIPKVTRKIKVVVNATTAAGYAIQTGNGGLTISNSVSINGNIYVNGRLQINNSSTVGTAASPAQVWVAGYGCGSGPAYPSLCAGTSQSDLPIYIGSSSGHIYGNVHAPNMTGSCFDCNMTRQRMTLAGLVDAVAPPLSLPDTNRTATISAAPYTNVSASTASCAGSQNVTWNARTHFIGNNDINISNNCTVTITGDIWIQGSLRLSNNGRIVIANGLSTPPKIFIDGQSGFQPSNSSLIIANSSGVSADITTFWSTAGACSQTPPGICPVPSGAALQNSSNTVTIQTNNSFSALGARFYAAYSQIRINNSVSVGQLIAQKIELSNSGIITFGNNAAPGTGTWRVRYYEQL